MNYAFAELILNLQTLSPFLLPCPLDLSERQTLYIEISLLDQNENWLWYTLPEGRDKLNDVKNLCLHNATIEYILSTKRFNVPLWNIYLKNIYFLQYIYIPTASAFYINVIIKETFSSNQ